MRFVKTVLIIIAGGLLCACANPADHVPRATASAPVAAAPARGEGEKIPFGAGDSRVEFTGSKVTGSESGRFEKFSGDIHLVGGDPARSRVEVRIDLGSVKTDSPYLGEHLKEADFFDVANHPEATFVSTEIKPGGERGATHTVTGDLTLRGVRKSITYPATIRVSPEAVTVKSEFAINRKDFQITYAGRADDLIRDEVVLRLSLAAPRQAIKN